MIKIKADGDEVHSHPPVKTPKSVLRKLKTRDQQYIDVLWLRVTMLENAVRQMFRWRVLDHGRYKDCRAVLDQMILTLNNVEQCHAETSGTSLNTYLQKTIEVPLVTMVVKLCDLRPHRDKETLLLSDWMGKWNMVMDYQLTMIAPISSAMKMIDGF